MYTAKNAIPKNKGNTALQMLIFIIKSSLFIVCYLLQLNYITKQNNAQHLSVNNFRFFFFRISFCNTHFLYFGVKNEGFNPSECPVLPSKFALLSKLVGKYFLVFISQNTALPSATKED